MRKNTVPLPQGQGEVNAYFQAQSSYWKNIYSSPGVYAEIHRDRYKVVLSWIDSLALAPGSQVLEIGCGAGFMSVALAQRAFQVQAIDSVAAMIESARRHADECGVANSISFAIGDVYSLAFADLSFDLVIAIGVLPWLERPEMAIQEMARVTKSGGHVIVTADNRMRLNNLLDPWLNPVLAPVKRGIKAMLHRTGLRRLSLKDIGANSHSCHFIDGALARAQLDKTRSMTLGFGPFSLFRHTVIPEPLGIGLYHRLQRLADRNVPVFRSTGAHYLVHARKTATQSPNLNGC